MRHFVTKRTRVSSYKHCVIATTRHSHALLARPGEQIKTLVLIIAVGN